MATVIIPLGAVKYFTDKARILSIALHTMDGGKENCPAFFVPPAIIFLPLHLVSLVQMKVDWQSLLIIYPMLFAVGTMIVCCTYILSIIVLCIDNTDCRVLNSIAKVQECPALLDKLCKKSLIVVRQLGTLNFFFTPLRENGD